MGVLGYANSIDAIGVIIGLFGGLALFLYGMQKMSDGLKAAAGESMKTLLSKLTTNRFMAAITGCLVTAVLQSSSITTVLVVGFVSAGLMTLSQSVGVIMGANVGTTITAQILAFNITEYAWLMIAGGFAAWFFSHKDVMRNVGSMLMGLGLLFIGMGQMGEATNPLRTFEPFIDLMSQLDNRLLAMLVGAVFTALVQSSSATIGIVIMLATQGHLTLEAGICLGIGSKIGTCVTAVLAGIGKRVDAQRVGLVHVLFNLFGALLWLPFIDQLASLATAVSPAYPELMGTDRLAAETPRQVANSITIFAIINVAVMIWFVTPIARLAERLIPTRRKPEPEHLQPKYLDEVFIHTPALALGAVRREMGHLGEQVVKMLDAAPHAVAAGDAASLDAIVKMDDDVDTLHTELLNYMATLARQEMQKSETIELEDQVAIANNLEAIGDVVETNLVAQGRHRLERNIKFAESKQNAAAPLWQAVTKSLRDVLKAVVEDDSLLAREVSSRRGETRQLGNAAFEQLTREMLAGDSNRVTQFRIESDIITQIQRLGYHVERIAMAVNRQPDRTQHVRHEAHRV